jgi:ABC-2 type transport system ATP-binding protein
MNEFAIEVKNLSKTFPGSAKKAVDNLTISVEKGKIYGFLGPNGSGKTTTMRIISGLLTPDEGSGSCLGFDIRTQGEEIRKKIGYMTQKFSYWGDLTLKENLDFVAAMFSIPEADKKVLKIIEDFGLKPHADKLAGNLSGGWKQRLALAASIIHEPRLLLLDEPTAGVDPYARREFWDKIHELADSGITILVSTHYMDEAERCHKIIYILNGVLIVQGTLAEIIAQTGIASFLIRSKNKEIKIIEERISKNLVVLGSTYLGEILKVNVKKGDREQVRKFMKENFEDAYEMDETQPSMEDSFIFYMGKDGVKKL